jgi:UDP-N-acetylmuramate dehydrogenase
MEAWMEQGLQNGTIREQVPLSEMTTFRIGGPADYVAAPRDIASFCTLWEACKRAGIPHQIIGKGSNILASDEGYRGMLFLAEGELSAVRQEGECLIAGAGISLAALSQFALQHSQTGLEFAAGIPGSLGGAIYMNAGAYGGEMSQVVEEVRVWTPDGTEQIRTAKDMDWGYRHSSLQEQSAIVLEATLRLQPGDPEAIRLRMKELAVRRKEKQPLEWPSAGSVFKRPEGAYAGALIEEAGLKGYAVGGACVSVKHAGFIINQGGATSEDVLGLIRDIQERVRQQSGIRLQPEIRFLGPEGLTEIQ